MQFISEWRKAERRILCNLAINSIVDRMPRHINIRFRRILAIVVYLLVFELIGLLGLVALKRPLYPMVVTSLLAALEASLSIYLVNWCYRYTLKQMEVALRASHLSETVDDDMAAWVEKPANIKYQLLTAVVFTGFVAGFLFIVDYSFGLPFDFRDAILLVPLALFGSQGIHYALVMPSITERIVKYSTDDLARLYPFEDGQTV